LFSIAIIVLICQRLQEVDDRLIRTVRHSMGRNVSGVEAEIKELEREMALPGKIVDVEDFDEVSFTMFLYFLFSALNCTLFLLFSVLILRF
jgi:hypothetical protein